MFPLSRCLVSVLSSLAFTIAGQTVELSGVVTDRSGALIPAASVSMQKGFVQLRSTTDEAGAFRFKGLDPGEYELQISRAWVSDRETADNYGGKRRLSVSTHPRRRRANRFRLVTTEADGYLPESSTMGTKLDLPLLDTPQSVGVVGKQVIEDRGIIRLSEVSRMNQPVPGGPRRRDSRNVYASYLLSEEATEHNQRRLSQRRVQIDAVAERLSMFSPLVSMQLLLEEVAGTSPGRYRWFGVQAERFIREWRAFFAEKMWRLEDLRAADITGRPQYEWKSEPTAAQLRRVVWAAGGLNLWLCLCAFIFFRRLERFPPM